jgi:hypothetical protein
MMMMQRALPSLDDTHRQHTHTHTLTHTHTTNVRTRDVLTRLNTHTHQHSSDKRADAGERTNLLPFARNQPLVVVSISRARYTHILTSPPSQRALPAAARALLAPLASARPPRRERKRRLP